MSKVLLLLVVMAPLSLIACGGGSPRQEVLALVRNNVEAIAEADADRMWSYMCPSFQRSVREAEFRSDVAMLFPSGEARASNLTIEYVRFDGDFGEVKYSFDLSGPGYERRLTETYAVGKEAPGWCFTSLLGRE